MLFDELATLGIAPPDFPRDATGQRAAVSRAYHALALVCHPDKPGGSETAFKQLQDAKNAILAHIDGKEAPPSDREFAASAVNSTMATYCAEERDGALRIGSLLPVVGKYAHWRPLNEFKLSARLQAVLPTVIGTDESREPSDDELDATVAAIATAPTVALCGFTRLDPCFQREFARHAMFKRNHAIVKRSAARMEDESAIVAVNGEDAVAPAFKVPDPSDENYVAGCLNGTTVVMSGVFDFLENSGVGLTQGKGQLKAILESFGARVTTSISKKTTFLLVGNEPGASKLQQCNLLNVKLVSPKLLLAILARGHVHPKDGEDDDPLPTIGTLSGGFGGGKGRSVANLTMEEKESIGLSKCQRIA